MRPPRSRHGLIEERHAGWLTDPSPSLGMVQQLPQHAVLAIDGLWQRLSRVLGPAMGQIIQYHGGCDHRHIPELSKERIEMPAYGIPVIVAACALTQLFNIA